MRKHSITRTLHQSAPGSQPGSGNEKILDGVRYGVNRQAARVLKDGVHWDSKKRVVNADSANPLPMRKVNKEILPENNAIGLRNGRLTVVGLAVKPKMWVCRCDCGTYVHRTAKAMKNKDNHLDRCEICRQKLYLQKVAHHKMTGKYIDLDQVPGAR